MSGWSRSSSAASSGLDFL
uniref:Uncharacterized protein n=1 Tax=Arundo donax TaxID=35708 RepID=A0A0A8YQ17_ARUDO